jgi:hypothetical protein
MRGFLDMSGGNLLLRNNNIIVQAGDISLNGNLTLNGNLDAKGNVLFDESSSTNILGSMIVGTNVNMPTGIINQSTISMSGGYIYVPTDSAALTYLSQFVNYEPVPTYSSIGSGTIVLGNTSLGNTTTTVMLGDMQAYGNAYFSGNGKFNAPNMGNVNFGTATLGAGSATLSSVYVTGDMSLNGRLLASSDVSLGGRLYVTGAASFRKDISVNSITIGLGGGDVSTNTTFGLDALEQNTTGDSIAAYGRQSLQRNTTGSSNCAFGYAALYTNTTGSNNSAFGEQVIKSNNTGSNNSAFGRHAMIRNTTGNNNSAVGVYSLYSNTTGHSNNAFGGNSIYSNVNGTNNNAFGNVALYSCSGSFNAGFGDSVLYSASGNYNTAIGYNAFATGTYNNSTAIGYNSQPTASNQIMMGTSAETIICGNTVAIGKTTIRSGYSLDVSGSANFSEDISLNGMTIGLGAGNISTNTTFGFEALKNNTTGIDNISIGYLANNANTVGNYNVAIGVNALKSNQLGSSNLAIGRNSLQAFTGSSNTDTYNIALGQGSLISLLTGTNNIALGFRALCAATTANYSTGIGYNAAYNGNYSYCTSIGYNSQPTADYQIMMGTSAETMVVPGDSSFNGNLTIGKRLTVNSDISLNGNLVVYGNLRVQQVQNANIINTTVNNYQLVVTDDISLNGRLLVSQDANFGGNLIINPAGTGTTGRVGIGTSTPAYALDVNGTIRTTGQQLFGTTTNNNASLTTMTIAATDDVITTTGTFYGKNIQLNAGSLNQAGGATWNAPETPAYAGSVYITGGNYSSGGNNGTAGELLNGGNVYLRGGYAFCGGGLGGSCTANAGSVIFETGRLNSGFTYYQTYTERMRIHGPNGNVGINTATPQYKLDVNGTVNSRVAQNSTAFQAYCPVSGGSGGPNIDLFIFSSTPLTTGLTLGAGETYGGRMTGGIIENVGGYLALSASNSTNITEGLRIVNTSTNANVGIGTTTPAYPLDVNGTIHASSTGVFGNPATSAVTGAVFIGGGAGVSQSGLSIYTQFASATAPTGFAAISTGINNVGNPALALQNGGGNVGIGTTTPAYTLDVNGTSRVTGLSRVSTVSESFVTNTGTTSPYTFDYSTSAVFYVTSPPAANFTANFTNVPAEINRTYIATLIITSTTNKRFCNSVQINNNAVITPNYAGGIPTSITSGNVITQTIIIQRITSGDVAANVSVLSAVTAWY